MAARVPVPIGVATSPMRIWLSVVATSGGTARGVQVLPVGTGLPSALVSGAPLRSRIWVTGVGLHCVPLAGERGVGARGAQRARGLGPEGERAAVLADLLVGDGVQREQPH